MESFTLQLHYNSAPSSLLESSHAACPIHDRTYPIVPSLTALTPLSPHRTYPIVPSLVILVVAVAIVISALSSLITMLVPSSSSAPVLPPSIAITSPTSITAPAPPNCSECLVISLPFFSPRHSLPVRRSDG